jgi:hypothetical protein
MTGRTPEIEIFPAMPVQNSGRAGSKHMPASKRDRLDQKPAVVKGALLKFRWAPEE